MLENLPGEVQRSLIDEFRRGFHREEVMAQIQATAAAKVVKKDHRSVGYRGDEAEPHDRPHRFRKSYANA